jgi:hypothetical protein
MEPVNYHTLAYFRSSHKDALDRLFVEVLGIMSAEGLITLERVMQDGTKVKALAGADSLRREERIREHLQAAKEQIRQSLDDEGSLRVQRARERAVREKKERMEHGLGELEKMKAVAGKKEARVSMTDPDARVMKQSDGGYAPSYNLQLSTDAAAGVVVGVAVSQRPDDSQELVPAVRRIKETMDKIPRQVVADGGYTSWENVAAMDGAGVDFIGSITDRTAQVEARFKKRGVDDAFRAEHFIYDETTDTYTCPLGKTLRRNGRTKRTGHTNHSYRSRRSDCGVCPQREKCCTGKAHMRTVVRRVDDPVLASFLAKMKTEEAKHIYSSSNLWRHSWSSSFSQNSRTAFSMSFRSLPISRSI